MSSTLVMLLYGAAVLLALALLYLFEPVRWYWHLMAVAVAIAAGLAPLPPDWRTPLGDALVGCVFLFLFVWGICAPAFRKFHRVRPA